MNNQTNTQVENKERETSLNTRKIKQSTPKTTENHMFDLNKVQLFVKKSNRNSAVPSRSSSRGASKNKKSKKQNDPDKSDSLASSSLHSRNFSYNSNTSQDSEKNDNKQKQLINNNNIEQFMSEQITIKDKPQLKVSEIIGPSKEEVNQQFLQKWKDQSQLQQQAKPSFRQQCMAQGNYRNQSVSNPRTINQFSSEQVIMKLIQGQQEKQEDENKTNEQNIEKLLEDQIPQKQSELLQNNLNQAQYPQQIQQVEYSQQQLNKKGILQSKSSSSSLNQLSIQKQNLFQNLSANSSKSNSTNIIRYNPHQMMNEYDSFENLTTNASYTNINKDFYQSSPYYGSINTQYNYNQQPIQGNIYQDMPSIQQSDSQKYLQQQQQYSEQKLNPNFNNNFTPRQRCKQEVKQEESAKYNIDLNNIEYDERTTLMIRNIPNKYTQNMILQQINQNHKNLYDFFYLPIDHNNKCNVGYAFINFIDRKSIKQFVLEFDTQRWIKFNSEKICEIKYARIQGKDKLNEHFQNSSVMNQKDKKCKPIFIDSQYKQKLKTILEKQKSFFN